MNYWDYKGKYFIFCGLCASKQWKIINDVNIFIMKYKCLELAMEETKMRSYVIH